MRTIRKKLKVEFARHKYLFQFFFPRCYSLLNSTACHVQKWALKSNEISSRLEKWSETTRSEFQRLRGTQATPRLGWQKLNMLRRARTQHINNSMMMMPRERERQRSWFYSTVCNIFLSSVSCAIADDILFIICALRAHIANLDAAHCTFVCDEELVWFTRIVRAKCLHSFLISFIFPLRLISSSFPFVFNGE